MSGKDIEKYIFDPQAPRKCKVYKLLLRILRQRDGVLEIDPGFFLYLHKDTIFDKAFEEMIWDAPEHLVEKSPVQKAETFIKNYSVAELSEFIASRVSGIGKHWIESYFKYTFANSVFWKEPFTPVALGYNYSNEKKSIDLLQWRTFLEKKEEKVIPYRSDFRGNSVKENAVLFLNEPLSIRELAFQKAAVVITLQNDQKIFPEIPNLKPLFLKDIRHLDVLLTALSADLRKKPKSTGGKADTIFPLDSITIRNYFTIDEIKLTNLKSRKEIYFLGENGDGKTILLQAIALAMKGSNNEGDVINVIRDNPREPLGITATDAKGNKYAFKRENGKGRSNIYENLFAYGINRLRNDSGRSDQTGYLTLFSDEEFLTDPRAWLKELDHYRLRGDNSVIDFELAKEILMDLVDGNIDSISIEADDKKQATRVVFRERGSEVSFDQLSHGYRNVMVWVCDLVSRLYANQPDVDSIRELKGAVVVDEIGHLLHPTWQYRIVKKLRTWFPEVQFFFSTHSPSVILGASEDAIFYKLYKEDGITKISDPIENDSNMMANALLTSPLFNLDSAAMRGMLDKHPEGISDADFVYRKIYEAVSARIKEKNFVPDEEVMKMVEEELSKLESEDDPDRKRS